MIATSAVAEPPLPSMIVYVSVSPPVYPALGGYVIVPSTFHGAAPCEGGVYEAAVTARHVAQQVSEWEAWITTEQARLGRVIPEEQWAELLPLMLEREEQEVVEAAASTVQGKARSGNMDLTEYLGYGFSGAAGENPEVSLVRGQSSSTVPLH